MRAKRFYIGKKAIEEYVENIEEWIADKVGDPPPGTACECDKDKHAHESEPDAEDMVTIIDCPVAATSYSYRIDGEHICYTWLCQRCAEETTSDDYLGDVDAIPTTAGGYAVAPVHCS